MRAKLWIVMAILLAIPAPALAARPPQLTVGQYMVQYRGAHTHSLGSCESLPVKHVHFDLFKVQPKKNLYVARFHVGRYAHPTRGACWLAYQSEPPAICVNPCRQRGGGSNGLRPVITVSVQEMARMGRIILTGVAILVIIAFMVAQTQLGLGR